MDRLEEIKKEYGHKNIIDFVVSIDAVDIDWLISETQRLRTLVEEAYKEGYFYAAEDLSLNDAWSRSTVLQALKEK